jgi:hypothetical protein
MTKDEYEERCAKQNNRCAICDKEETDQWKGIVLRLSIDHNHETGENRGLLCRACNLAIGKFNEDIGVLERAIEYLKLHNRV